MPGQTDTEKEQYDTAPATAATDPIVRKVKEYNAKLQALHEAREPKPSGASCGGVREVSVYDLLIAQAERHEVAAMEYRVIAEHVKNNVISAEMNRALFNLTVSSRRGL